MRKGVVTFERHETCYMRNRSSMPVFLRLRGAMRLRRLYFPIRGGWRSPLGNPQAADLGVVAGLLAQAPQRWRSTGGADRAPQLVDIPVVSGPWRDRAEVNLRSERKQATTARSFGLLDNGGGQTLSPG